MVTLIYNTNYNIEVSRSSLKGTLRIVYRMKMDWENNLWMPSFDVVFSMFYSLQYQSSTMDESSALKRLSIIK